MTEKTIEIPSEFKPLFKDNWREAAIWGGRYSLKSHSVARYLLIQARMRQTRVGCFREFQNSIAESSHQLLADLIKQYDLTDFEVTNNAILNRVTGSDFLFKGLWHNEQSVKSMEGIDIAWVEEAQTISGTSIDVLTPTVRKPGSRIIYTYNRLLEDDPVHQRLVIEGRPNTLKINVNYDIALKYGWMPEVIRQEMEDDKAKRPALYRYKWLGEPNTLEQRIYKDWQIVDEIPKEARLERRYLDYGYSNDPTAIGDVYYCNGCLYLDEVLYQKGLSNKQIADVILNQPKKCLLVADSAEPKSNDELIAYGIQVVPADKGKDSVNNGIQLVQEQTIFVTRRSTNILKERLNYLWLTNKEGAVINEPSPVFNHHMDGIRYAVRSLIPVKRREEYVNSLPRIYREQRKNPAR